MLINQRNQWKKEFEQGKIPKIVADNFHTPDSSVQNILDYVKHLQQNKEPYIIDSYVLSAYRQHRDSESWRSSSLAEQLCEYILFLEKGTE